MIGAVFGRPGLGALDRDFSSSFGGQLRRAGFSAFALNPFEDFALTLGRHEEHNLTPYLLASKL